MAAEASRSSSSGSADSYIGSLISLTSKSEIRYEGVLFNINTEESSIGLRNVRSFGTEGRKEDGPQVPPSDKVYEYILFRGSDIKDLQVKSSPPVQTTTPIHNDPAIIQSHYPQAATTSTSLPSGTGSVPNPSSHTLQMGPPRSTFQGSLPLYQPGGNIGSWGSSPPPLTTGGSGLAVPMYWQGFYGPPNGLQAQPQSLLRTPPGLSLPPSMQQSLQYPAMNASLPTVGSVASNLPAFQFSVVPPPLLPPFSTGTLNMQSFTLPAQSSATVSDSSTSLSPYKIPTQALPTGALPTSLPLVSPLTTVSDISAIAPPFSDKPKTVSGPIMPYISMPEPLSSVVATSSPILKEGATPSLVTPGQLLQPGPTTVSPSQSSQAALKDVDVVEVLSSEPQPQTSTEAQAPILPLPSPPDRKFIGAPSHMHHSYRGGRERGRGNGISHPVTRFTEDFDFVAMNEKFNKDEVWGHLGKSNKSLEDGDDSQDEDDAGSSKFEIKPVYVKDDFFDSLSCNALDRGSHNVRTKFSEQLKIDTETFGNFPRHRGGRGGRGPGRGGRSRGAYYGRGYGYVGRGNGYVGRGRGQSVSSRGT